jgi:hypothetical protein
MRQPPSNAGARGTRAALSLTPGGCRTNQSENRAVNWSRDHSGQTAVNGRITGTGHTGEANLRVLVPPVRTQPFSALLCDSLPGEAGVWPRRPRWEVEVFDQWRRLRLAIAPFMCRLRSFRRGGGLRGRPPTPSSSRELRPPFCRGSDGPVTRAPASVADVWITASGPSCVFAAQPWCSRGGGSAAGAKAPASSGVAGPAEQRPSIARA